MITSRLPLLVFVSAGGLGLAIILQCQVASNTISDLPPLARAPFTAQQAPGSAPG